MPEPTCLFESFAFLILDPGDLEAARRAALASDAGFDVRLGTTLFRPYDPVAAARQAVADCEEAVAECHAAVADAEVEAHLMDLFLG